MLLKELGYSNRDIAQDLGISASTVSLYLINKSE
ncbi:LuxR C-terminal-related transcriptional regulator [Pseudoalteromonas xiamenensis]